MELVYLWIEDYKNIKKQGFNFSPRFECEFKDEYDENRKLKDNCKLIIDENKDYISIFPDDINITAIVGENGSGKSTIFEIITLLRLEYTQLLSNTNILILFENNKTFYPIIDVNYHDFKCLKPTQIINNTKLACYDKKSIYSSYLFNMTMFTGALADFTYQNRMVSTIRESSKYDNFYNGLSSNYTNPNEESKILEQSLKYTNVIEQGSDIFDFLGVDFLFDNFCFEIDLNSNFTYTFDKEYIDKIEDYTMKFEGFDIHNMGEYCNKFDENGKIKKTYEDKIKETSFYRFASYYYIETLIKSYQHFKRDIKGSILDEKVLEYIKELNHFTKIIETNKKEKNLKKEDTELLKYITSISLCNKYFDLLKKILNSYYVHIEETERKGLIIALKKELKNYKKLDILKHIRLIYKIFEKNFSLKDYEHEKYLFISKNISIQKDKIIKTKKQISKNDFIDEMYWSSVLKINFINGDIPQYNYNVLSSGEKQLFNLMINFSYTFLNLDKESLQKMVIFFDEIDVGFHPNWQKRVIYNLLILINKIKNFRVDTKIRFHLIFASHSSFLLSDIPKENVIFLEKGKQVYPFENGQTFGANIHTLLSHGFFMKNGLMGEFAKDKIDTAIKYLNQTKLSEKELEYCENIISIIGEPIIKRELQRKLDSKRLSKLDKIDEIEEQMELLAHRLEMIRKNQK